MLALLVGCSSGPIVPLGPFPGDVSVEVQETPYQVHGSSAGELLEEMQQRGPHGQPFFFRWTVDWEYEYAEIGRANPGAAPSSPSVCRVSSVRLTVTMFRTLPEWVEADAAPTIVRDQWDAFLAAVHVHGRGHEDVAAKTAADLLAQLQDLETPGCSAMPREAQALADSLIAAATERDRRYESATLFGARQGARWPR